MIGPVGTLGADAESAAPTQPETPPIAPAAITTRSARSVQNRAAAGGMMRSATIRISPTILRPITVTPMTSPIITRSVRSRSIPLARANPRSKLAMVIGRRNSTTSASARAPPPAMRTASAKSIPAVEPRRKLSSPAARPALMVWMTVRSTMPKPKNTESTAPMAASSVSRVRVESHCTAKRPRAAVTAEPASSPGRFRPSPPSATITMKASATPGSVA